MMGKKKGRQSSSDPVQDSRNEEENLNNEVNKAICPHVQRALDANSIRKVFKDKFKGFETPVCSICSKQGKTPSADEKWYCLKCANETCSLSHAEVHFLTPRSDQHSIFIQIPPFRIWCYSCKSDVPQEGNKKAQNCVLTLNLMQEKSFANAAKKNEAGEVNQPKVVKIEEVSRDSSEMTIATQIKKRQELPPVRGLANLGNTCFFNSVLQCLARTPNLIPVLEGMSRSNQRVDIQLKNGKRLEGDLDTWDPLSESLAQTLLSLSSGTGPTVTPDNLLRLLRKKCTQYMYCDQQDAHELLRHLLDAVRTQDLKRYRKLMLAEMGLSVKVNPQEVSKEKTKEIRTLDYEVCEVVTLVPEQVFKGLLVSTLECQQCKSKSQCVESFLDLSLPVMPERRQPPKRHGKGSAEPAPEEKPSMSKHQLKKERYLAKKNRGKKHGHGHQAKKDMGQGEPIIPEVEEERGFSDADVEDNVEDPDEKRRVSGGSSSDKCFNTSSKTDALDCIRVDGATDGVILCAGYGLLQSGREQDWSKRRKDASQALKSSAPLPELPNDGPPRLLSLNFKSPNDPPLLIFLPEGKDIAHFAVPEEPLSSPLSTIREVPEQEPKAVETTRNESSSLTSIVTVNQIAEGVLEHLNKYLKNCSSDYLSLQNKNLFGSTKEDDQQVPNIELNNGYTASHDKQPSDDDELPPITPLYGPIPQLDEYYSLTHLEDSKVWNEEKEPDKPTVMFGPAPQPQELGPAPQSQEDDFDMEPLGGFSPPQGLKRVPTPPLVNGKNEGNDDEDDEVFGPKRNLLWSGDEGRLSVETCLDNFTSIELMTGSNMVGCSTCTARSHQGTKQKKTVCTVSTKQLLIKQAPPVLILHLKRFQVHMVSFCKLSKHVAFPLQLDISPFATKEASSNGKKMLYDLYGVVEHKGNVNSGHYVAYVKVEDSQGGYRWYFISDSHFHEVAESRVLQTQAYLLFYKRTS